ncbi:MULTISPECIES: Wzz/FepE/Etk N-terminal domain-containing protein [unclassified Sphingomonas]|uniref:GumC family protein n=1 Tax=unclassified Sphingomonas TaxID=196159 RepID=UPI001F56D663|nr:MULTISPECIES: Wzz/FepE/Etk N-terminal domain-containing protein [unclassified Sphingomonas]
MNDELDLVQNQESDASSNFIGTLPVILWERRWLIIIPFVILSIAGIAAAFLLPRSYRSSATLLVESQNLPTDTTASGPGDTVIDRRMAKIRQQILSRPDLVGLIQANNLYDASARREPLSKLVDRMRNATNIAAVDADIARGGGNAGSIAFALTFDYPSAPQAQLVAQTFVDRLLKLDASETQAQAQTNARFLEDQEANLQAQVNAIETQINRITGQNGAALAASNMGMTVMTGGGDYDGQIATLERQNADLQAQTGKPAVGRDPNVIAAEAQLAAARAQYSDDHPDVKLAESRLAAAKTTAAAFQTNSVSSVVQRQIAANNAAIGQLRNAKSAERGRAATMAAAQARGPVIAQQVAQLQSRADVLRANLGRVQTSLLNARSVVKISDEQRGERLTLIDPPVTPDTPTQPNRPMLILGGIFGGLAVGVALALLIELIARPIRSVATLTRLTGVPPLAVIPVISKKKARRRSGSPKAAA